MVKNNKILNKKAYAVALAVASGSSSAVCYMNSDSKKVVKERSERRSADDLNRMFAEAFSTIYNK